MSDMLVINFAALHQASDDIQNALKQMETTLQQVESDAAPLVQTWDGDAQAAYLRRQESWRAAAADLSAMLRDIKVALDESAATYLETERRNVSMFQ